jgi:hypothetical protein
MVLVVVAVYSVCGRQKFLQNSHEIVLSKNCGEFVFP